MAALYFPSLSHLFLHFSFAFSSVSCCTGCTPCYDLSLILINVMNKAEHVPKYFSRLKLPYCKTNVHEHIHLDAEHLLSLAIFYLSLFATSVYLWEGDFVHWTAWGMVILCATIHIHMQRQKRICYSPVVIGCCLV